MQPRTINTCLFIICISIYLNVNFIHAQNSDENTITYKSPSSKFVDIIIQSHKGLPRLGEIHFLRGVTPPTNPKAFNALLKMKYMEKVFADMDRGKLTTYEEGRSGDKKLKHSLEAQKHLLEVARELCTPEELEKYFGPEKQYKSTHYGYNKKANAARFNFWGGDRNNEFAQQRAYTAFVKNNLVELQAWSKSLFEESIEMAYLVNNAYVTQSYDFQKKGYWIRMKMDGGSQVIANLRFIPFDESQKNLDQKKLLVPMTPEKAKKFAFSKRNPLMTVVKVKVSYDKEYSANSTYPAFSFELVEDPIIEVYTKDRALTEKIGEINLAKLETKY